MMRVHGSMTTVTTMVAPLVSTMLATAIPPSTMMMVDRSTNKQQTDLSLSRSSKQGSHSSSDLPLLRSVTATSAIQSDPLRSTSTTTTQTTVMTRAMLTARRQGTVAVAGAPTTSSKKSSSWALEEQPGLPLPDMTSRSLGSLSWVNGLNGGRKSVDVLPTDLLCKMALYMDSCGYLHWTSTCKTLRRLRQQPKLAANAAVETVQALSLIFDQRKTVFLTGPAGCGKTWLLVRIIELAKGMGWKLAITATTGRGCINLPDGQTIHSFSGLRKGVIPLQALELELADAENQGKIKYKQWQEIDMLVLDEVSMLGSRFLSKLDVVARHARQCKEKPFGGLQIVFTGDPLQLPPVGDHFFFENPVWKQLNPIPVVRTHIHRQRGDVDYMRFCQRVREGLQTEEDFYFMESMVKKTDQILKHWDLLTVKPTQFFGQHKEVTRVNNEEFSKLTTPIVKVSQAIDQVVQLERQEGGGGGVRKFRLVPSSKISVTDARVAIGKYVDARTPAELKFRDGAQYLLTFNVCVKRGHVNGARCIFKVRENGDHVLVFTRDGSVLPLERLHRQSTYRISGHNDLYLRRTQYCLRLGYSSTIHGGQGCQVDEALIDLTGIKITGMTYVALSRVTTSSGLYVKAVDRRCIRIHKKALAFWRATVHQAEALLAAAPKTTSTSVSSSRPTIISNAHQHTLSSPKTTHATTSSSNKRKRQPPLPKQKPATDEDNDDEDDSSSDDGEEEEDHHQHGEEEKDEDPQDDDNDSDAEEEGDDDDKRKKRPRTTTRYAYTESTAPPPVVGRNSRNVSKTTKTAYTGMQTRSRLAALSCCRIKSR